MFINCFCWFQKIRNIQLVYSFLSFKQRENLRTDPTALINYLKNNLPIRLDEKLITWPHSMAIRDITENAVQVLETLTRRLRSGTNVPYAWNDVDLYKINCICWMLAVPAAFGLNLTTNIPILLLILISFWVTSVHPCSDLSFYISIINFHFPFSLSFE